MISRDTIYDLIAPIIGCTVVWADQNAPQTIKPFAALRITSTSGFEFAEYAPVDENGAQLVTENRDTMLEIQVFGTGAALLLETLRGKLVWQTTMDAAYPLGIAVVNRSPVQNITALLDKANYEDRAMLEVTLRSVSSGVDQVGLIETVNGTGTFSQGAEAVLTTNFNATVKSGVAR